MRFSTRSVADWNTFFPPVAPTFTATIAVDFLSTRPMSSGYCAMWISGNAPPSPKSSRTRGMKPFRLPYAGTAFLRRRGKCMMHHRKCRHTKEGREGGEGRHSPPNCQHTHAAAATGGGGGRLTRARSAAPSARSTHTKAHGRPGGRVGTPRVGVRTYLVTTASNRALGSWTTSSSTRGAGSKLQTDTHTLRAARLAGEGEGRGHRPAHTRAC